MRKKNQNVICHTRAIISSGFQSTFSEHVMWDSCDNSSTNNATPELVGCTDCDETFSVVAFLLYEESQ